MRLHHITNEDAETDTEISEIVNGLVDSAVNALFQQYHEPTWNADRAIVNYGNKPALMASGHQLGWEEPFHRAKLIIGYSERSEGSYSSPKANNLKVPVIFINGFYNENYDQDSDWFSKAKVVFNSFDKKDALFHELVHMYQDLIQEVPSGTERSATGNLSGDAYFNNPKEFDARFRVIANDYVKAIRLASSMDLDSVLETFGIDRDFKAYLTKLQQTGKFKMAGGVLWTKATPQREKRMIQRLYQLHQKLMNTTSEVSERAGVDQSTSKTLYHGTTLDAAKVALENGLEPTIGEFVQQMYGYEDGLEELVFFADKKDISKAVTAMNHHVSRKLKKPVHKLTSKDIYTHGAMLVVRSGAEQVDQYDPNGWDDDVPTQVEPDDYYTRDWIQPDYMLTGKKLRQFITRLGLAQDRPNIMHGDQQRNHRIKKGYEPVPEDNREEEHAAALDATGYWGKAGAGCLIMAQDTGRVLIPLRSEWVQEPGTWGTWGGAIDGNEDPKTACMREVEEEAGYSGSVIDMVHLYQFQDDGFRYDTFLAVVPNEFDPVLNWETERAEWVEVGQWPQPLHFGLVDVLKDPSVKNKLGSAAS